MVAVEALQGPSTLHQHQRQAHGAQHSVSTVSVWVVGRDKSSDVEDNGDVLLSGAAAITARRMLLTLPPAVYTDYTLGIHRGRGSIVLGFLTSCSWEGVAELRW